MNDLRLSATAIQDWEECKRRFLYRYVYRLRTDEDRDSLRIGENWHACHEIIRMVPQSKCPKCLRRKEIRDDCYLCAGTGRLPQDTLESVTRYINQAYAKAPENKSREDWEVERITLLYSFSGYRWYFSESEFENVASEVWFDIPVINPKTRKPLKTRIVGKVDHILRHKDTGLLYVGERKSTTQSVDSVEYWSRLEMDVQISVYLYALRIAQMTGQLHQYGITEDDPLIHGIWYDVWSKPGIKPKMLSQKDTKAFIESGMYFDELFTIDLDSSVEEYRIMVNGESTITEPGKKEGTFAIRETPEMYGARLLDDISQRPEFYFEQREIARNDRQLELFEEDLYRIAMGIRYFQRMDLWTPNCRSCTSPFYCDYRNLCRNNIVIGPNDVPDGFKKKGG